MTTPFDRQMREALRAPAPPSGGCLDAESLAAWSEGTLDAPEREALEAHASQCDRCQALLAAMIRIEPPPEKKESQSQPESLQARRAPAESRRRAEEASTPSTVPGPLLDRASAPAQDAAIGQVAPPAAPQPLPIAPPPAMTSAAPAPAPVTVTAAPAPAPPAAAALPPVAETVAGGAPAAKSAAAESMAGNGLRAARTALVPSADQAQLLITTADGSTRWRVIGPGSVQRSTDSGAQWEVQATGDRAVLTAGAAPSPAVCWLVGRGGVVLLSVDGRTWRRVPFPEAVDLVSVSAEDEKTATVTSASGRAFTTTNGGVSWR
jgi:hypothetical protein